MLLRTSAGNIPSKKKKYRAPAAPSALLTNVCGLLASDEPAPLSTSAPVSRSDNACNESTPKSLKHSVSRKKIKYKAPVPPMSSNHDQHCSSSNMSLKGSSSHEGTNISTSNSFCNGSPDSNSNIPLLMVGSTSNHIKQDTFIMATKDDLPKRPLRVHRASSVAASRVQNCRKYLSETAHSSVSSSKQTAPSASDTINVMRGGLENPGDSVEAVLAEDAIEHSCPNGNSSKECFGLNFPVPPPIHTDIEIWNEYRKRVSDSGILGADAVRKLSSTVHDMSKTDCMHYLRDMCKENDPLGSEKMEDIDSKSEIVPSESSSNINTEVTVNNQQNTSSEMHGKEFQIRNVFPERVTQADFVGNLPLKIGESPDLDLIESELDSGSFHTKCIEHESSSGTEKHISSSNLAMNSYSLCGNDQKEFEIVSDCSQSTDIQSSDLLSADSPVKELVTEAAKEEYTESKKESNCQWRKLLGSDAAVISDIQNYDTEINSDSPNCDGKTNVATNYMKNELLDLTDCVIPNDSTVPNSVGKAFSGSSSDNTGGLSKSEKRVEGPGILGDNPVSGDDFSYNAKTSESKQRPFFSIRVYSDRAPCQESPETAKNCSIFETHEVDHDNDDLPPNGKGFLPSVRHSNQLENKYFKLRSYADGRIYSTDSYLNSSEPLSAKSLNNHSMSLQRTELRPSPVVVNRLNQMCRAERELDARVAANFRVSRSKSMINDRKPSLLPKSASLVRFYQTSKFDKTSDSGFEVCQHAGLGSNTGNNVKFFNQTPHTCAEKRSNRLALKKEGRERNSPTDAEAALRHTATQELARTNSLDKQCSSFFYGIKSFNERECRIDFEGENCESSLLVSSGDGCSGGNELELNSVNLLHEQDSSLASEGDIATKNKTVQPSVCTDSATEEKTLNSFNKCSTIPTTKNPEIQMVDVEKVDQRHKTGSFVEINKKLTSQTSPNSIVPSPEIERFVRASSPRPFNVQVQFSPYSSGYKDVRAEIASLSSSSDISSESPSPDQMSIKDRMKWLQCNQHVIMGRYKNFIQNC